MNACIRSEVGLLLPVAALAVACGSDPSPDSLPIAPQDAGSDTHSPDVAEADAPPSDGDAGDADVPDEGGPNCGDEVCSQNESCETCAEDCGACEPTPCTTEGGRACGGNGIPGQSTTLYVCANGFWQVDHACDGTCESMPSGVPDRCPDDVVAVPALIDAIDAAPYVEQDCVPGSYAGWPFKAQDCTYSAGGITTTVTVANPSAERVALWIADASTFIPTLWRLKDVSPSHYEEGIIEIGLHMLGQSSRIFPLHGGIIENMGSGYTTYPFDKGVTEGCSSGCYCRINSLHRTEWCGFQEFLGAQTYDACLAQIGDSGLTNAWGQRCLQNHIDAWTATSNEHFRAKAWTANKSVKASCPTYDACSPGQVVGAVQQAYN